MATTYWQSQEAFGNTLAALLDTGVQAHVFDARVHPYRCCLEAALYPEAIPVQVYSSLVDTLKANLGPLHRLFRLRQRMLGLDRMTYADVYASGLPQAERTFTFEEAKALVRRATAPLGPDYQRALETALTRRWVDVYPNRGKQSGAYCHGPGLRLPPVREAELRRHLGAVSTLAHELGHAMHTVFADRAQPFATSGYTPFLGEVASTFNENLLVRHLLASDAPDAFKVFVLDNFLEEVRATLYRQGLFAQFERAMHERGETGVSLTPDWLNRTYLDLTR